MCGIFGWVLDAERAFDERILVQLTDQLNHRGPDGSGHWLGKTADQRFQVGLGHRRLSIIDIAGGAQPMWSTDGDVVVTFNGEIYNYVELREELQSLGHAFHTTCDTEVLIEAYRRWGDEALSRFRGMFAFALFDVSRQRLLLARDPFGKKPLFVVDKDKRLFFGSEIAALLDAPGLDRNVSWDSIAEFLIDRYVPGPATMFRSIKKLPAGSKAVWENGRLTTSRYFTPPIASVTPDVTYW